MRGYPDYRFDAYGQPITEREYRTRQRAARRWVISTWIESKLSRYGAAIVVGVTIITIMIINSI